MKQDNNNTSVSFSIRNQGKVRNGKRYDEISITDDFDGWKDFISQVKSGDDARQTAESIYELLEWKGAMYDSTVDTENGEKDVTRASRYESQGVSSKRLLSAFAGVLQDR